jgi:hypothetical protein
LLQVVSGQSGTITTPAVEDDRCIQVGHALFDITFDNAFAKMNGVRQMILRPFAFLTHIDQDKLLAAVELGFDIVNANFSNALLGIFNNLEKTRGMLRRHRYLSHDAEIAASNSLLQLARCSPFDVEACRVISGRAIRSLAEIFLQVGFKLKAVVVGEVCELEGLQTTLGGPHRKEHYGLAADGARSHVKHHLDLDPFV